MKITPEKHLALVDPKFAELFKKYKLEPHRRLPRTHFEALVEAIISQQLSVKAADTIFARFVALFPRSKFPKPEAVLKLSLAKFRAVGISGQKSLYIKDLSARIVSRELKLNSLHKLDNEAVIDELTKVKGIGRWTAEMFLMFTLRRPDVFSTGDLGLRNAIQKLYNMKTPPTERQLERISKRWVPHRTTAARYLWKSLENS
ncbi:MAG TPA: DNA-3-methyladenine glycosylase [Candidatus Doudnabacteria bacterium]|nr:DNA-3-methyladenine glycosylase [Candidatus Doudnabacteria bacterium]